MSQNIYHRLSVQCYKPYQTTAPITTTTTTDTGMTTRTIPACNQSRTTIGLPAKRHLNGVSLTGRWWSAFSTPIPTYILSGHNRTTRMAFRWWAYSGPHLYAYWEHIPMERHLSQQTLFGTYRTFAKMILFLPKFMINVTTLILKLSFPIFRW